MLSAELKSMWSAKKQKMEAINWSVISQPPRTIHCFYWALSVYFRAWSPALDNCLCVFEMQLKISLLPQEEFELWVEEA